VALSDIDRNLIQRCLAHTPKAWKDFVDRYMGLVVHVVNHTAQSRSIRLTAEDRDDLAAEVFLALVHDNFAVLRHFRGESSLATYLTVVARRVVVRQLLDHKPTTAIGDALERTPAPADSKLEQAYQRDEIERLLAELEGTEAAVVRMYHLEGKTYREISSATGMAENSVGPTLSRARSKMRQAHWNHATGNPQ